MPVTEPQLISIIAAGECDQVDFKRELNLDTAVGKAEFVKDVLALANSVVDVGYLLIGVEDTGSVVGTTNLEEERIQQILQTYVNPPLSVSCSLVALSSPPSSHVGIIAIRGAERPYKVARSIERLSQNEVFVRHGTVIVRASPEEIYRMYNESHVLREQRQHIRSAETYLKLKNVQSALTEYTKAIELLPTSDLLVNRAKTYMLISKGIEKRRDQSTAGKGLFGLLSEVEDQEEKEKIKRDFMQNFQQEVQYRDLAVKDLSDAVVIAESFEIEKLARSERVKILSNTNTSFLKEIWSEDLAWLKDHTTDKERSDVILLEIERIAGDDYLFEKTHDQVQSLLDEIEKLGHSNNIQYYTRRLEAHFGAQNYGLVLREVEKALAFTNDQEKILYILGMKGWTLSRMNKFNELFDLSVEVRGKYNKADFGSFFETSYKIEKEIICRYAIDLEFAALDEQRTKTAYQVIRFFRSWYKTIESEHPKIASIIRQRSIIES